MMDHQHLAPIEGRVVHTASVAQILRHRLFADDIQSRIERVEGQGCVELIGCGDQGRIGLHRRQRVFELGERGGTGLVGECLTGRV